MTAHLSRIVYRIGSPENDHHHFTDQKDHADIAKNNGYEVSEYVLAGMDSEPVYQYWCYTTVENSEGDQEDFWFWSDCDKDFFDKIDGKKRMLYAAPPAPVAVPDDSAVELLATDLMKRIDKITGERHSVATLSSLRVSIVEACRAAMLKSGHVTAATVPDDTKRLDWLDAQNKRLNEYYGTSYGWKFDANFQRNAMMLNDSNYPVMTVRQAIDEAMLAAAPAAPEQEV